MCLSTENIGSRDTLTPRLTTHRRDLINAVLARYQKPAGRQRQYGVTRPNRRAEGICAHDHDQINVVGLAYCMHASTFK